MARHKVNTTKKEIMHVAMKLFLEKGYSHTTIKNISEALDISTGNLTFHYPTKEHLLAELTNVLCQLQWKMFEQTSDEEDSMIYAIGTELLAMVSICEEDEIAKDFYLASYMHKMSLELIRKSDAERAKLVFGEFCQGWTDEDYRGAEILVSGIEYATLMQTDDMPLETRVANALDTILMIYQVPKERRERKIKRVLAMDYRTMGQQILAEFREFIKEV